MREITEITAPTSSGIALETLDTAQPTEYFYFSNSLEELSHAIDDSPYFMATFVREADGDEKIIVTNVNYGVVDHHKDDGTLVSSGATDSNNFTDPLDPDTGSADSSFCDPGFCTTIIHGQMSTFHSLTKIIVNLLLESGLTVKKFLNAPYVCSFTEDKCDGGGKCRGSGSPETVYPDQFNAIYRDDDSGSCYRARARLRARKYNA